MADPGFPPGGGTNFMKLKEFEPGGAPPPLDPPLGMELDQEKGGQVC